MELFVSRKVSELTPDQRRAFETFLGTAVGDDESISVRTLAGTIVKQAPIGIERPRAYRRLSESMDKIAQGLEGVPDEELESAIDEAVDHARHPHHQPRQA